MVCLSEGISPRKNKMATKNNELSICTFNCRGVKSSLPELQLLCETHDIVCLQEHWLLPYDLSMLSQIHADFLSCATSAVNVYSNIMVGRPYGGTGILYRRRLAQVINTVDTNEPRMTAITLQLNDGPVLIVNVYMPTDYGNYECYEEYLDMCTKISALFNESAAAYLVVLGDFNCSCLAFMIF